MSTTWVKVGYAVLLAAILAVTVGFGVLTFEAGPKPPQPAGLTFSQLNGNASDADQSRISKQIDGFYDDVLKYREKFPEHQRNIFLWFAGLGIIIGVIGVALPGVVNYLRFGFVLGGLTLLIAGAWYALQGVPQAAPPASSLLTLFSSGTPKTLDTAGRFLRFAVSIVGLLVMLFVGLWRLTDWSSGTRPVESRPVPGSAPAGFGYTQAPGGSVPTYDPAPRPTPPEAQKWGRPDERTYVAPPADSPPPATASAPAVPVTAVPPPEAPGENALPPA
jgi:hypothetical protein